MKPARFSYEAPMTVAATLAALAAHGDAAKIIAGGQSLAPMMNMRIAQPGHLIDINRVAELADVHLDDGELVCGALMRHADLTSNDLVQTHAPMLAHAASTIGHYAIRQRGTLGGSLAHADPAAQLPLAAVALDARIEVASERGRRQIAASDFFASIFTTVLNPDELVCGVRIPLRPAGEGWGFRLLSRRAGDFALTLVACTARRSGAEVTASIAVGAVAATPIRIVAPIPAGDGGTAWIARTASLAAAAAKIEDNEQFSAEYRRELVETLVGDALRDAVERAT